jgi:hypothetical protein
MQVWTCYIISMPSGGLVANHNRNQCITSTLGWWKFTINIDDKGGENMSIESLFNLLMSVKIQWNRFPDLDGTGFSVSQPQYPFCQANSVAPSFQKRWHRFWLLDATGPCNKFSLASIRLENLWHVCLDVCWTFLCLLRLICMLVWSYEWCDAFWQGCLVKTGGTEFGNSMAPSLARQHCHFLALFVEMPFSSCITIQFFTHLFCTPLLQRFRGELHVFLKMCKLAFKAKVYEFHS